MKHTQISNIRIDSTVIITMIAAIVIGAGIITYKAFHIVPCVDFNITPYSQNYFTGEGIKFSSDIRSYKELDWSFGDGTNSKSTSATVYHIFKNAGDYTITLTVNKTCKQYINISISDAPLIVDSTKIPRFTFPNSATVGVTERFQDHTKDAVQWAWRFGETASIDATSPNPSYTFKTPGLKTVSLMINNDTSRVGIVKIFVNPASSTASNHDMGSSYRGDPQIVVVPSRPDTRPLDSLRNKPPADSANLPPVPNVFTQHLPNVSSINKAPDINRAQLEGMLRQIPDNSLPENYFAKYMKDIKNTEVNLNGHPTTFDDFYNKLKGLKKSSKIKTLNVQMVKDQNGYIKSLNVEFDKRSLFDL